MQIHTLTVGGAYKKQKLLQSTVKLSVSGTCLSQYLPII